MKGTLAKKYILAAVAFIGASLIPAAAGLCAVRRCLLSPEIPEETARHVLLCFCLLWLCFSLLWCVFTRILYRTVSRPIRKILRDAKELASVSAGPVVPVQTSDEIEALYAIVNQTFVRLQTVNEDQRQFIANVSHDLRSPLTSIKGYLEAIQDGTIPPELEGKYISIVLQETNRLTDLTRNLLTVTSLDSKMDSLERTQFDINSVIRQMLLTFEQRCQNTGVTIRLSGTDHPLFVRADLVKIQQVLYNLIDNAIKFSASDSRIDISTSQKSGKALISVKDYGAGIPKESLPRIWNRFYKTDPSRSLDKKGTGLGLSIVQDIVRLHGETIRVNSREGEGSEFVFTLPVAP